MKMERVKLISVQAADMAAPLPSVRERHPRAVKKEVDYHQMPQHGRHVLDDMAG